MKNMLFSLVVMMTLILSNVVHTAAASYQKPPRWQATELSENCSDVFSYVVSDNHCQILNIATVTNTINSSLDATPAVVDEVFSLTANTSQVFDVIANDVDENLKIDVASLGIVQTLLNGTALVTNGTVAYQRTATRLDSDSLTYKVSDLTSHKSDIEATVSIDVEGGAPPIVTDDSVTVARGETVIIDVFANDTAETSIDPLSITFSVHPKESAAFALQEDGTLRYTHNGNETLEDTFSYKVKNPQGIESLADAVVTIRILPPLITIDNLSYAGAFRFPTGEFGQSTTSHAQSVIEVNNGSVFIAGHRHHDAIAEFSIPDLVNSTDLTKLNTAADPIQDYAKIIDRASNSDSLDQITGLEWADGRLVVNLMEYYDGQADNTLTTMVIDDASQLATSQVSSFHYMEGAARAAGWLSPVPEYWQAELGADFISGHASGDPIIGRLSVGPSAFTLDLPASLASLSSSIPTTELQGFSLDSPLQADLFNDALTNDMWTHLSRARYGFIVPNTSTYVTVGWSGGHSKGVGYKITRADGTECPGHCANDESDVYNYYWLWKVQDWLSVKAGDVQPHEILPYAHGKFDLPFQTNGILNEIGGGSYDPQTGLLYLTLVDADIQGYEINPVVVVYEVNTP